MTQLFFGCYCTPLKVFPANWNDAGASIDQNWYIYYRFYDPTVKDAEGKIKPKLVMVKSMNSKKTLQLRREATRVLLDELHALLTVDGWNPITSQYMADPTQGDLPGGIDPQTPFIKALRVALNKLDVEPRTRRGINSVITGVEKAAVQLRYQYLPIGQISRKYIKNILERCANNSPRWSNNTYNAYRAYLRMLFVELVEQEATVGNPINDIKKRAVTKKIRPVLSAKQREQINEHLSNVFPAFYHFVHLFFHSGGRKTELLQLKPHMVNLEAQTYKCVIKKRRQPVEVERTIKDVALPHWRYFVERTPEDMYLFGPVLNPGEKPMGSEMPTVYWNKYVKKGLGIAIDFYTLKHLNTTETVDYFERHSGSGNAEAYAAQQNGHTSTGMVVQIYDTKQKARQHDRLKGVNNPF